MDFLQFLSKYEKEDVRDVSNILETNKQKEEMILKEAFNSEFVSKKEALLNITQYFTDKDLAPKNIDTEYVRENLDDLISKIQKLDEGDIRIIIQFIIMKVLKVVAVLNLGLKKNLNLKENVVALVKMISLKHQKILA